jgi:hypothetical protein
MSLRPIDVGSERQLFLDDTWFDSRQGVELKMHQPTVREVAIPNDRPWELGGMHYSHVSRDGDRFKMWYRSDPGEDSNRDIVSLSCYAESDDGIVWEKPSLGLREFDGSTDNNVFYPPEGDRSINPSVIVDHSAPPSERYKMVNRGRKDLRGYTSADGLRWTPLESNPIHTDGPFDSQNILIWDDARERYVVYMRGVSESVAGTFKGGHRSIRRSESADFRVWTPPRTVVEADEDDPPDFHFYTNAAVKYARAANAFLMFPMVFHSERQYPTAPQIGLADIQLMTSRDGISWDRRFREAFMRPGRDERNWVDRNPIMGPGILETGPDELSLYFAELLRAGLNKTRIRRCTIRTDGFVSVHAPYVGWSEFTTPPLTFAGGRLEMNYSTAGGGSILVELQDESGTAVQGFELDDCDVVFGDKIEEPITWGGNADVSELQEKPVRMRVRMRDADLFAFRFAEA